MILVLSVHGFRYMCLIVHFRYIGPEFVISLIILFCRLDHILLETTGLANPAPLASVLWLDDQLESAVKLDSIITVSI